MQPIIQKWALGLFMIFLGLVAAWHGFNYVLHYHQDFTPDKIMAYVRENSAENTPVAIGHQADWVAHWYYARIQGIAGRIAYYSTIPPELLDRIPETWLIAAGDEDLKESLDFYHIPFAERAARISAIRNFGRFTLYKIIPMP